MAVSYMVYEDGKPPRLLKNFWSRAEAEEFVATLKPGAAFIDPFVHDFIEPPKDDP
jgi:hypothetical protein